MEFIIGGFDKVSTIEVSILWHGFMVTYGIYMLNFSVGIGFSFFLFLEKTNFTQLQKITELMTYNHDFKCCPFFICLWLFMYVFVGAPRDSKKTYADSARPKSTKLIYACSRVFCFGMTFLV